MSYIIISLGFSHGLLGRWGENEGTPREAGKEIKSLVLDKLNVRCLRDAQVEVMCRQMDIQILSSMECSISSALKISHYSGSESYHQQNFTEIIVIPHA